MKAISVLSTAALVAVSFFSTSAARADNKGLDLPGDFSANVALTTDYVFRGISQSNEEPTIQGGIDWSESTTGLYLGLWGSGVDFNDASAEFDFYGGISGSKDAISWDLGAIYYHYPGSADDLNYDFWELAAAAGYDFGVLQTSLSLNYSPDYFGASGDAYYLAAYVTAPLPYDLTASGHVAHQWISDNAAFGTPDYTDWSLGLGYTFKGFDLGLTYHDTDLNEPGECADGCSGR
ncbi:MAG TPA: TorF family putative porin, partial [Alphaproteobacteria bacterium]|nr:TorF family putative porin [Alphaproteobacteria bacterium]